MTKFRRILVLLGLTCLFVIGIYCGIQVSRWFGLGQRVRYNTVALLKQVQPLSDLVTVKYIIEKAEVWNDPPQNLIGQMFAGDNHILILAHGVVKAGVDLSKLKPEDLEIDGKNLLVKLPPAQVTDAYLDDGQTKVIERTTGFLRSFDKDLEQNIRQMAVEDIRLAALRGGIRQEAEERARAVLTNLFRELGFDRVRFKTI
ncbi:MAG: DUF4230 domain-containing protein [Verrucomicrobiota bacterium]